MTVSRFGIIAVMAAGLALAACSGESGGDAAATGQYEKPNDRAIGDPNAPVTVVEYASITCSHCKAWHDNVWPDVKENLIDTGKVRFVFRELPTAPMDVSVAGFLIARCAPENRYFNIIGTLFDRQERLFTTADRRGELLSVARAAGLNEEEFNACIRDEDEIARINEWTEEAFDRYQITGTPGFIINGQVHQGQQPYSVFADIVEETTGEPVARPADEEG